MYIFIYLSKYMYIFLRAYIDRYERKKDRERESSTFLAKTGARTRDLGDLAQSLCGAQVTRF